MGGRLLPMAAIMKVYETTKKRLKTYRNYIIGVVVIFREKLDIMKTYLAVRGDSDENGIFDEPGGIDIELISVDFDGGVSNNSYRLGGSISDDGRLVFFIGATADLVGSPFTRGLAPVIRDRAAGRTVLAFTNIFYAF